MPSARVGTLKIVTALSLTNAATAVPTSSSNGVAVPDGYRHEYAHLITSKANTAVIDIYGMIPLSASNVWTYLDTVSFARTTSEAQRLVGVTGMIRLCPVRTDANVSNKGCNVFFGFSEAMGV